MPIEITITSVAYIEHNIQTQRGGRDGRLLKILSKHGGPLRRSQLGKSTFLLKKLKEGLQLIFEHCKLAITIARS